MPRPSRLRPRVRGALARGELSIDELMALLGASRNGVARALEALRDAGHVTCRHAPVRLHAGPTPTLWRLR